MNIMNNGDHKFTPAMLAAIELAKSGSLIKKEGVSLELPMYRVDAANDVQQAYDLDM